MTAIYINDAALREKLQHAAEQLQKPEQLTNALERVLVSQTLQNFQAQGRPKWAGLSPRTIENLRRQGVTNPMILQRTAGGLKDSVQGEHDAESASVMAGSGKSADYAAIHQFGGMAGRNRRVKIPARPYLPIGSDGALQPEAEDAVEAVATHFLDLLMT